MMAADKILALYATTTKAASIIVRVLQNALVLNEMRIPCWFCTFLRSDDRANVVE